MLKRNSLEGLSFFQLKENYPIKPFDCEFNDSLQLKEEDFPSKSKYKKFLSHLIPHPKRHLKSVPAVKIGRLAIDKTYRNDFYSQCYT
jgi:acetyltransferase, GNAT family